MGDVLKFILGMVVVVLIIYGTYWLYKNGSYWLWYEDMVTETIKETVKESCLIK